MSRKATAREQLDECVALVIKRAKRELADDSKPLDKIVAALASLDKLIPRDPADTDPDLSTGVVILPPVAKK